MRKGSLVALCIVAGVAVIGTPSVMWGVKVATSDIKGAGDTIIRDNGVDNRVAKQELFEELYADIEATDRKVAIASAAKAENPDDRTASDTYLGTVNICISLVGEYNAEARKVTSDSWRAVDLPYQIDNLNPSTDCK
jgi:hypothetical protein